MNKREAAEHHGRRAEMLAAWWLCLKGYRLRGRRVRNSKGEIDLVMQRGKTLIFVEVKARASLRDAQEALTLRGLARMRAASRVALGRFDKKARLNHRFDAVLIAPWHFPRHIQHVTNDE